MHYLRQYDEMEHNKYIYFMDETSVNLWLTNNKTWSCDSNPISLPMQPTRLRSRTIIACVGDAPVDIVHQVCEKTNTASVILFLRKFILRQEEQNRDLRDVVLVTDNHPAHRSYAVADFLNETGL